jgi:pyruvate, orthophosphate dikinase
MPQDRWVYAFSGAPAQHKDLLGGKGAGLAEMTRIGLPVPPGFTITTRACLAYREAKAVPPAVWKEVDEALAVLEKTAGQRLGDPTNPLLVSVRSGAAVSMPGMMDTVLNLGLNDQTVEALAKASGNAVFAYDSYRRFISMFSEIVLHVPKARFDEVLDQARRKHKVVREIDMSAEALRDLANQFKALAQDYTGKPFPLDPKAQLRLSVQAVFDSWDNRRAATYRKLHKIPDTLGTAVNVQAMVFGNRGPKSASGVAFTRDPSTGRKILYGEYLPNSQGEDVVAGIRTPLPISKLKEDMPQAYAQFETTCALLEKHYKDVQDVEFTIQDGKLYMLQTRTAKRTARAAIQIAVDLVSEGLITQDEALGRVEPQQLDQMLHRQVDPAAKVTALAKGLPASPGAATGRVVFDADEAESMGQEGKAVVLVRMETTPDDIHGFAAAQGILTARGGMSSHAAVVARGMGKPCVAGCEALKIDYGRKQFVVGDTTVKAGDVITLDGSTGRVLLGEVPTVEPGLSEAFKTLLKWADGKSRMSVRANADTPADAKTARELGAVGIGLCRTEHMFMGVDRLPVVRSMILAEDPATRQAALDKLLPMQQSDFAGIFRAMDGFPVTIRLIDPPLHEFLPNRDDLREAIEDKPDDTEKAAELKGMLRKAEELHEANPMMGFRGCRLSILFPEIIQMQTRAILSAACEVTKEGVKAMPEIMVPLVGHVNELRVVRRKIEETAHAVFGDYGIRVEFKIGTMIEVPRAALTADEIAEEAEFFSFGTNDLTQMTFGFSRDDAEGRFLFPYLEKGILESNPFEVLDRGGVGKLVAMAVDLGRSRRPKLKIGICGEHGGEPQSVEFCHRSGLDYVSCSPFRVPIARLAAAQAVLREAGAKLVDATA